MTLKILAKSSRVFWVMFCIVSDLQTVVSNDAEERDNGVNDGEEG